MHTLYAQTVSIHLPKHEDKVQGYVNNQQQDWSFPLDGVSSVILIFNTRSTPLTGILHPRLAFPTPEMY